MLTLYTNLVLDIFLGLTEVIRSWNWSKYLVEQIFVRAIFFGGLTKVTKSIYLLEQIFLRSNNFWGPEKSYQEYDCASGEADRRLDCTSLSHRHLVSKDSSSCWSTIATIATWLGHYFVV